MTNGGNFITFNPYVRLKRWFPGPVNNFPVNYQQSQKLVMAEDVSTKGVAANQEGDKGKKLWSRTPT
jgi:hypothetical protein